MLNQVLFRFESDERTLAIRISVSNWQTTAEDVDRTVAAFATAGRL